LEKNGLVIDLSGSWGVVRLEGIRPALASEAGNALTLSLNVSDGRLPGEKVISGTVRNRSDEPVRLDFIQPLTLRTAAAGRFRLGSNTNHIKALVMSPVAGGYNTRIEDFQGDVRPVEYVIQDRTAGVTSSGLTALYLPDEKVALVMGYLDFSVQTGTFNVQHGGPPGRREITELTAELEYLKTVAPGETVRLAPLWLAAGNEPFELLERYAYRLRNNMHIKLPKSVPCGWISWYAYRESLNERIVRANVRVQARTMRDLGGTLCHLDLGWNSGNRPGDWLETDKRYPDGIQKLCRGFINDGFQVALWSTPLVVSEKSRVAIEHPEWFLRDRSGKPVSFGKWYWEPMEECYCLDPSLQEVQEHVRKIYETLRGWGVTAFKLDFSAAFDPGFGNGPGPDAIRKPITYAGQSVTRMEACRKIYGIIRQAIGDAHMTVCNAPWQGVVGIADSIFLANDIGNLTDSESRDERPNRRNWDYFRERTRQVFVRYFFNGKVWWGNPDCFVAENDAPENYTRARLQVVMLAGGQYKCSNQLPDWKPERMKMFLKGLPWYGKAACPVDLFESDYPAILDLPVHTVWGDWHVIGLFNWENRPRRLSFKLGKLRPEVRGKQLVWDFWEKRFLGIFSSECFVKLPAESATLLCVRPVSDHPTVLATDIHFTMGGVEIPDCSWDEKKRWLFGLARRKKGDTGNLFFYLPAGYKHKNASRIREGSGSVLPLKLRFKKTEQPWLVQF